MITYAKKELDAVFAKLTYAKERAIPAGFNVRETAVLADAVREMDRHLPDFFSGLEAE